MSRRVVSIPIKSWSRVMARIGLCVCLFLAATAAAQAQSIELKVPVQVLEVGEVTDAQLVCTNIGKPGPPKGVVPDGLTVHLVNDEPTMSSYTSMIQGHVSSRETFTYLLRVTGARPGTYELGPMTVEADGTTYESESVQIVVKEAAPQAPRGEQFVFVELEVGRTSLYVTESYRAMLTIGIRKVEQNGRPVDLDLLRSVIDFNRSQLSVFSGGRVTSTSELILPDARGQRHRYEVYKVERTFRADEVGEMTIGPIFLVAEYPTEVRRGFFGAWQATRTRRETARAEGVVVTVKGPPEESRPADFTGAVGQYRMEVSATPPRVEQGKPVTLTIAIRGSPLDGLAGPSLASHAELASRFEYAKEELVGDIDQGAKVFRRAIFPKQPGEQTIPPISWSYFDPRQERYVTLVSDPIPLVVDPPAAGAAPIELVGGVDHTSLTVLTGGIEANYVDAEAVLVSQAFVLRGLWAAVLVAPPLVWLAVAVGTWRYRRLRGDVALARRRRARRRALARIHTAAATTMGDHGARAGCWDELAGAVKGYLSDRFNLAPGELTPFESRKLLARRGADEQTARELSEFLDACNAARYAPGAMNDLSPPEAARRIRDWIQRIEKSTR